MNPKNKKLLKESGEIIKISLGRIPEKYTREIMSFDRQNDKIDSLGEIMSNNGYSLSLRLYNWDSEIDDWETARDDLQRKLIVEFINNWA